MRRRNSRPLCVTEVNSSDFPLFSSRRANNRSARQPDRQHEHGATAPTGRDRVGAAVRDRSGGRTGGDSFRPDAPIPTDDRPSRQQSGALLAVLLLVAGAVTAAAYLVRPDHARSFALLSGSMFLADQVAPVGVDLASGKPTLRLVGAEKQVGARSPNQLSVVPLDGGTMLLDRTSGQFNIVDRTGFVIKHDNGGVPLPARTDATQSSGVAAGGGAFVERSGPAGTDIYLVDQLTVRAATNLARGVAPRASIRLPQAASPAQGASAAADGSLWTLLGTGNNRTVHEFGVAPTSPRGARLSDSRRAGVEGPAAIAAVGDSGSATATDAATGTASADDAAVGVASANGIRYFDASASRNGRKISYHAPIGVDTVLAATSSGSRFVFLLHASSGWSVVSLARNGTGLRGPTALAGMAADANLATPAMSAGKAYTVDRTNGRIYRIDMSGAAATIAGATHYPIAVRDGRAAESANISDAYVVSDGPRVFVNSPSHVDAVALFTDGSRTPLVVRKSAAVDVSAAAGAQALARADPGATRGSGKSSQSRPKNVGQAINNRVDCRTIDQKPHIPVITQATPGSRSVALAWSYPLLDTQDCAPSTYGVSVKLVGGDAPAPIGSATVQGQQSTDLTGLYPLSRYQVTVTAYLHGQGTTSAPVELETSKEGPAAPTGVRVTADSTGNWHVGFNSCGSVAQGCVPAASWRVIASFCDGLGLSSPPATVISPGDPTSVAQPSVTVPGSDDLLGRGLRFQIEGEGSAGESGTASAASACVYSWTPPVPSDITVIASTPPNASTNGTTSTTATVRFANGPVHDLGGVGGTLTYQLLSGGVVQATRGPTSSTSVVLGGVRPGQSYSVRVIATAPRHPGAVATIGPVPVNPAIAEWPTPSVSASFQPGTATDGTLSVVVGLPPGTQTRRETFDLVPDSSSLSCDSTSQQLTKNNFSPDDTLTFTISRLNFASNNCTVTVQLAQNAGTATSPPLYGAANSTSATTGTFAIPNPLSTTSTSDFAAQWSGSLSHPSVDLAYSGADVKSRITNWRSRITNGGTGDCGSSSTQPNLTIDVTPLSCISDGGTFVVHVTYSYFGSDRSFDVPVGGAAPQPVDPAKVSFDAAWEQANPVIDLSYTGSRTRDDLKYLNFTETVTSDSGVQCGDAVHLNPADQDPMQVPVDLTACPALNSDGNPTTYKVNVQYTDDSYHTNFNQDYTPKNQPPQ